MINKIIELKNKATERANYYSNLDFTHLAEEFTEFANFLAEMETVVRERDELQEKITKMTFSTNEQKEKIE